MYLLVIVIILIILFFIIDEIKWRIQEKLERKPKPERKPNQEFNPVVYLIEAIPEMVIKSGEAIIMIWKFLGILFGILILIIKFLFEYSGLVHGYKHYVFLILIGLIIAYIPIYYDEKSKKENVPFFCFIPLDEYIISFCFSYVYYVTFIVILDEFLIYAIENRNFKQEVTGITKGFFLLKSHFC